MPVVIGAKPESNFADPIGLLTDCHRRIERFLSVLVRLGGEGELTPEKRVSLETALRYFREAAPKHTADEEESLFPRLRSLEMPEVKAMLGKLDALETDHERATQAHTEMDRLGQQWLAAGRLSPRESEQFAALATELAVLYRQHIAAEEDELFPLAAAALQRPEREEVGKEMAARRGLNEG
jgi:hemerythrin-like domain-containing protein